MKDDDDVRHKGKREGERRQVKDRNYLKTYIKQGVP
jgi:hypothetical protein